MKKNAALVILVTAAFALAGCRNRETPLTGSYGSRLLVGQVVMATGGSPSGVEVSVSGTGMGVVLGEDGRFSFLGVPDSTELQFRRTADGIDARLRVEPSSVPVVVELSNNGARGRRRSTGRSLEYEGVIKELGEGTITLFTSHKTEVEIALAETTVIRKGQGIVEPEDLEVDWRVHVKAFDDEGVLTAREVIVQNTNNDDDDDGENGGNTMTANGEVLANEGGVLTVRTVPHGEVTVQTDGNTIIKRQGVNIPAEEIEVGWEVNSMGTRVDDTTLLARQIEVRGNSKKPKS